MKAECPECGFSKEVSDSADGRKAKCPDCETVFQVTSQEPESEEVVEADPVETPPPSQEPPAQSEQPEAGYSNPAEDNAGGVDYDLSEEDIDEVQTAGADREVGKAEEKKTTSHFWRSFREHFSFKDFVAPKLIRACYVLAWVLAVLSCGLVFLGVTVTSGFSKGLGAFAAAIGCNLIALLMLRLWFEVIMIMFSIHDRLKELNIQGPTP